MPTPTVIPERLAKLPEIHLDPGGHRSFEAGHCVTELSAWLAGENHTDQPKCVSPVLAAFMRSWNDGIRDQETRDRLLKPYAPRVIGTRDDGHDEMRAWMAVDWQVRVSAPAWLELAGLPDHAKALRGLPQVTAATRETWQGPVEDARAAGAAARAAAWAAAGDAARDAAWAAARDAARAAAWAAAGAAARDAAWDAARDAARAAAWAAARDAARAALTPTVETLQASALDLLERMVSLGESERSVTE